ncbi:MAG: ATP-grasp domain-containing protein [Ancrocorticia sp.]
MTDGKNSVDFNCCRPDSITTRADWLRLVRKWDTNQFLAASGLPVPRAVKLDAQLVTEDELKEHAESLGYPLVLKPNVGSKGQGVMINLRSWDELKAAYDHLVVAEETRIVQMETYHEGDDYRVLVVGDKVAAACLRVPANVVGDGTHTIRQLIDAKNKVRRKNPFLSSGLIKVDEQVLDYLAEQGVPSVDVVLPKDKLVNIRRVANASAGGDVVDVTNELPQLIKDTAVKAVAALPNIVIAGVDVLFKDGDDPTNFTIIEMNSRPQIGVNIYPSVGVGPDVPSTIVDHFFPDHPRKPATSDDVLRFDPRPIQLPLEMAIADTVSLKPLPEHHFPYRRVLFLGPVDQMLPLKELQVTTLRRIAESDGVVGQLDTHKGKIRLIIGAEDDTVPARLINAILDKLNVSVLQDKAWSGVLSIGFDVSSSLLKETT